MTDDRLRLRVNGKTHAVSGPPGRTLLRVIREDLGLVGTRGSCGIGVCGACTVLVDGRPVSGCLVLAEQAADRDIVTIEGLAQNGHLHPVQQAFIDHMAFQCAYCTSGFILTAVALLEENPRPSDEEIRDYLAGNLCRCGAYGNIAAAVKSVADRNARETLG